MYEGLPVRSGSGRGLFVSFVNAEVVTCYCCASATCEPVIIFSLSFFARWITSGEYSPAVLAVAKLNHLWALGPVGADEIAAAWVQGQRRSTTL